MNRKEFIKNVSLGTAAVSSMGMMSSFAASAKNSATKNMFVGTPVLPEYLYESGMVKTLDAMQELAGINAVMTFSHNHVFRQYSKGNAPKTDAEGNPLTNTWVKTNKKYYSNPAWAEHNPKMKYSDRDVLDDLYEEAKPRGMEVYARILEPYVITGLIDGFENFVEVDANGNKGRNVCYNHPEYIEYWDNVVEDLVRSHPYLHGFKFGQERGGPILSSMGKDRPGTCFCAACTELAKQRGIDVENARQGLIAIQEFGNKINAGHKPVDGNFVTFLRILTKYPNVLAWEQFWMDSREEQRKRMYKQIKNINPDVYKATTRSLEAGVDGLWCGREWDELKPENAAAFGRAVNDWK